MSEKEATPSGGAGVVIPEHLRKRVRIAAEWRVVKACKNVTVPMEVGDVRNAVHELDGSTATSYRSMCWSASPRRRSTGGCRRRSRTAPGSGSSCSMTST